MSLLLFFNTTVLMLLMPVNKGNKQSVWSSIFIMLFSDYNLRVTLILNANDFQAFYARKLRENGKSFECAKTAEWKWYQDVLLRLPQRQPIWTGKLTVLVGLTWAKRHFTVLIHNRITLKANFPILSNLFWWVIFLTCCMLCWGWRM